MGLLHHDPRVPQFSHKPAPSTSSPQPAVQGEAGFFSDYFLIPKWEGGLRPVLDVRGLNQHLRPLRCRMLTVPRVLQAINQGNWFATVDLKDAYFQIPIWGEHWRFLQFQSGGRTYKSMVLPFGISLAFTRCMDAILGPLCRQGLWVLNYLDDWLMCHYHVSRLLLHINLGRPVVAGTRRPLSPLPTGPEIVVMAPERAEFRALGLPDPVIQTLELARARPVWHMPSIAGLVCAQVSGLPLGLRQGHLHLAVPSGRGVCK